MTQLEDEILVTPGSPLKNEIWRGGVVLKFPFKIPFLHFFLNDQHSSSFHIIGKQVKIEYLRLAPEELSTCQTEAAHVFGGVPPKIALPSSYLRLAPPELYKRKYFLTSAQGLSRNLTLNFEQLDHYPRGSKQKKVEFDRLVLSPPPSPSKGVGILQGFLLGRLWKHVKKLLVPYVDNWYLATVPYSWKMCPELRNLQKRATTAQLWGWLCTWGATDLMQFLQSKNLLERWAQPRWHPAAVKETCGLLEADWKCWSQARISFEKTWILETYSDADWAGNRVRRKSTSCGIHFLNGSLVFCMEVQGPRRWYLISLSSYEPELHSIVSWMSDAIFARRCLDFLPETAVLQVHYTDSSSARQLVSRQGCGKIRHLSGKVLWVQGKVHDGEVHMVQVPTAFNAGDIGTKPLHLDWCGGLEWSMLTAKNQWEKPSVLRWQSAQRFPKTFQSWPKRSCRSLCLWALGQLEQLDRRSSVPQQNAKQLATVSGWWSFCWHSYSHGWSS